MKVIKRDGTEVQFDVSKIENAISKANKELGCPMSDETIQETAEIVEFKCGKLGREPNVEEIQDLVIKQIMASGAFDVAKAYTEYRYKRSLARKANSTDDQILSLIECANEEVKQENSNKNPTIISTQRDYMAGEVSKDLSRRIILDDDLVKAHDEGMIHIHDLDYFVGHCHNCDLIDLDDMLQNGTVISSTKIDKPHSFHTACNIATQIIAQVSSSQFGGQSITLSHLAPFVDVSRQKIRSNLQEMKGAFASEEEMDKVAQKLLQDEIERGIQTLQYQIITLMTTNGQAPFITVFMYLNEVPEGQTRDDLALIIEEMLKQRIQGVKNEKGVYISPAFPKIIYVLDENNTYPGSEYYYLTELAAKCSAKRLVPDYISAKKMKELKNGDVFPAMGCVVGDETVNVKDMNDNRSYHFNMKTMWEHYAAKYDVKIQQGRQYDMYIDLTDVKIYDNQNGWVDCYRIIKNKDMSIMKITFDNGYTLKCTFDHPLTLTNEKTIRADELTIGDTISVMQKISDEIVDSTSSTSAKIVKIENLNRTEPVYDVTTSSEHFTVSGIWSHNCRSFLSPWYDENGKSKYYGRFNMGVTTINLVDAGLSAVKEATKHDTEKLLKTFKRIMNERLELCHRALIRRYERLRNTPSDVAPILWQHGALARLKKGETIDKLLHGGYSTISLGYAGLWECVYALIGKKLTEPEGEKLGLEIMDMLNEYVNKWKEAENIGYALYGTPKISRAA